MLPKPNAAGASSLAARAPNGGGVCILPEKITHHTLTEAECTCGICGKIRPDSGLTEESEELEWEVNVVCHRHIRHRYGPSCDCPQGRGIVTAPKPAKLIPKGLFAVSFWTDSRLEMVRRKFGKVDGRCALTH